MYVDDVPFGDAATFTTDLLAVDRVEVFRGPQGTRFGKNSEAGVIRLATRKPGNIFEAEGGASFSTFNSQQYQASAMGALVTNQLFFSLAGKYATSDGFIHNDLLNSHVDRREALDGRAALRWSPLENWDVDFTVTGDRFNDGIGIVSLRRESAPCAEQL